MKKYKFQVGDKVVPHSKSCTNWCHLYECMDWNRAKEHNQPYLFVVSLETVDYAGSQIDYCLSDNEGCPSGSFFMEHDLTEYKG